MRRILVTYGALCAGSLLACAATQTPSSPSQSAGPPTVNSLSPSSGKIGAAVVVNGSNFTPSGNQVKFGLGYIGHLPSDDGKTLRFVVPDTLSPCPPDSTDPCPTILARVAPGASYQVAVIAHGESSNTATFTVTQ